VTSSQPTESDHYKVLGVAYSATPREITRAYREGMKRTHPDRVRPELRPKAEERAKQLNLAYRTLSNPLTRKRYDESIRQHAVQDQIMSQYFGGFGMPGSGATDPFGESLRRTPTAAEAREKRVADRSAMLSILVIFGGTTALVVGLLVVWALVSALAHAIL
jgi:DnaJ-class molecular chaperone